MEERKKCAISCVTTTTTTYIYAAKKEKSNTLILKHINKVLAAYNNHNDQKNYAAIYEIQLKKLRSCILNIKQK